ncbi:Endoglucanase-4 [Dactylella cylindrospora]|nr:Endoglucanase-4 [Dactylella cylindrospora]
MLAPLSLMVALAAFLPATFGHYTFQNLIYKGVTHPNYKYIRRTWNYINHFPLFDLDSTQMRCFEDVNVTDPGTLTVKAGDTVGFTVDGRIIHEGPLLWYLARAPLRQKAASMDGSGPIWFKFNETYPEIGTTPAPIETFKWPHYNATDVHIKIPKCLPSGEYLLRVEHIAIHIAFLEGQHEFFGSCAQLKVTSGGSATIGPNFAEFPGAYKTDDPGLFLNVHEPWVQPQQYIVPGPPVWSCP